MAVIDVEPFEMIGSWLGERPDSDLELAGYAEDGLPLGVVKVMTDHGLTQGEVSSLVIPSRTLKHRKSRKERLSRDESDKAIRTARILAHATNVFGGGELALEWMRQAKHRFKERSPMQMMETEVGGRLVEEMLFQIEHGMFA
jgi:putative toxin-antitoxin system antitoxin component (TIGR02293 family)